MKLFVHRHLSKNKTHLPSVITLQRIAKGILRKEKTSHRGELHVIFVEDHEIRALHKRFLNDPTTTDVISFPGNPDLGDIYVCVPEAKRNAKHFKETLRIELIRLVIHGLLHILGYNDHNETDRSKMWRHQEAYVKRYCNTLKSKQQFKLNY